jgi:hypothetical protein
MEATFKAQRYYSPICHVVWQLQIYILPTWYIYVFPIIPGINTLSHLAFTMETRTAFFCEFGTEFLNMIQTKLIFQRDKLWVSL